MILENKSKGHMQPTHTGLHRTYGFVAPTNYQKKLGGKKWSSPE